jgi:hypothetical protein
MKQTSSNGKITFHPCNLLTKCEGMFSDVQWLKNAFSCGPFYRDIKNEHVNQEVETQETGLHTVERKETPGGH